MVQKWRQFKLLLWKNFLIQKRKVVTTVFEIGLPAFFALILVFIRLRVTGEMMDEKEWAACGHWQHLPKEIHMHQVAFAPDNNLTRRIMKHVTGEHTRISDVKGFENEEKLVDFMMFENSTTKNLKFYLAGVVFTNRFHDNGTRLPRDIAYKLRFQSSPRNAGKKSSHLNPYRGDTSWNTDFIFPLFQHVGPREPTKTCGGTPGYAREGFLALQNAVNYGILKEYGTPVHAGIVEHIDLSLRRHPYPRFNDDNFIIVIQSQFPLILMLSFVLVALNIVKDVVHEKERKLKESMKMMGLNNWLHWAAWYVKYLLFLLITVGVMTLFLCINTSKGPVIGKIHPSIVFLFLFVYANCVISSCFAASVFFNKANSGAAAGGILFFVTYIPYFFIQPRYATFTWGQKIISSLIPNVAMAYGGQIIGMFEGTGVGVQWSNIMHGVSVDDDFSMFNVIAMLLVDTVLYAFVTWYVEAVFPGEFGVPLKWYFPVTCSYWCGTKPDDYVTDDKNISIGQISEFFEKDPSGLRAGIQIRNLRKEFKRGENKKVAVSGMTLDMYEGQITALLGHNGAGKTTTMSMLTGLIPTTSGTARVNGFDIREDIASVRSSLGLCPQHDVLFDSLTVEEHLIFFSKLKGVPDDVVGGEVTAMLDVINLTSKRHAKSSTLSGGMKRKLSVGIALIGGSKVVILDEPSSGMDPEARRQLWTVLQQNKRGRTMLLSTHFMDEADHLGDRISIMADGVVKCCGSSTFLKNKYGAGYHMTIVKAEHCDVGIITQRIKHYVPEAELENNVAAELSYILPSQRSSEFEKMFLEFDRNLSGLGIQSYGIAVTTMEEVFLRVGKSSLHTDPMKPRRHSQISTPSHLIINNESADERTPLLTNPDRINPFHRTPSFTQSVQRNTGLHLLLQQFYAMFLKRAIHTARNLIVTGTQLSVPLSFAIIGLVVIKTFPGPHDSPPLSLTIDSLGDNVVVYSVMDTKYSLNNELGQFYSGQFNDSHTTSVEFVNNQKHFSNDSDITKYLLKTARNGLGIYNLRYLVGASINSIDGSSDTKLNITAYFNNHAFHTPAISLGMVAESLLQYLFNDSSLSLSVTNHPLPRTTDDKVRDETQSETTGFTVAFNIVFGMAFLASSFALFLIKERSTKAKHLQLSSGVNVFVFWSATFCWDIINYLMMAICLLITIRAFNVDAYVAHDNLADIALLFLLYGLAMLPFMYLCSFLFTVPASGYVWLTMFNMLTGVATILAVAILSIPQLGLQDLSKVLEWIFLVLLPNFCLGQGLEDYYSNYKVGLIYNKVCPVLKEFCNELPNPCCQSTGNCGEDGCLYYNSNPLGWEPNGIGRMLFFLSMQFVFYTTVLLCLESEIFHSLVQIIRKSLAASQEIEIIELERTGRVQEDDDVARERSRIANNHPTSLLQTDKILLSELSKCYDRNIAVNRISLGIPQGECFGLLGVNGAGKTSTFKMLTGDESITSGTAFLNGKSVSSQIAEVRKYVGYCPQFDALIDQMTGRETLFMFARLRGIAEIPPMVNDLLSALLLEEYADKHVQTYSGGNKRKLSTAIALIGNPPVIFLDEPTTGMDPNARRHLWDTLCNIRASGRTLVLTSHSMEECEALCTRLAVMVNGHFKCLGSPQHLKNKFSEGYILFATVGSTEGGHIPETTALQTFIEDHFPNCVLKDVDHGMVHYHITDTSMTLAHIFGTMERAKTTYNIEDYSVSQTTLEQVFINFARTQQPPVELQDGCCKRFCFCSRIC
ncbi:phospholipid-transporting ATPase ABCA3-like isoform X2 [Mya arenaria]|uniref:phospholipid-transporting ATPase ABCA3-like isoform X2 n=1 Tax=Mya arenaria TaxID=6604 RepID=UPI0022E9499D|nr:phospholipid-transporting ATPase ABCA3-like isoform X2 [Mya arenaria]